MAQHIKKSPSAVLLVAG